MNYGVYDCLKQVILAQFLLNHFVVQSAQLIQQMWKI